MSITRKLCYLALVLLFIFSLLPFAGIHLTNPVQAASAWVKLPSNQFTLNQKYVLDSTVIYDTTDSKYKMWYTHVVFDMSISQLVADVKGLNLNNLLTALQGYQFSTFLDTLDEIDATSLWTILNGTRTVIGYAESTDGKVWTVVNSNVLGTAGNFFASVGFPSVIKDGSTFKMWYTSIQSSLNQSALTTIFANMGSATESTRRGAFNDLLNSTKTVIKYATSTNGTLWTIAGTPALDVTTGGDWGIFRSVGAPSVIMESSTDYKMWYTRLKTDFTGTNLDSILTRVRAGTANMSDLMGILDSSASVIGYATSTDGGATFTVVNDKVLPTTTTPAFWQSAADPCVIKTGSTYEIWYMNGTTNIIQSTLTSIFNEIKLINIPNLWTSLTTLNFTDFITDFCSTNVTNLKALLSSTSGVIGYASSSNGTDWTASPIDMAGTTTTPWGSVGAPSVLKTSSTLTEMWFSRGLDTLTYQNIFDRVMGNDTWLGYASLTITPTTTPTTTSSGGGGGGGGGFGGGPGITSVVNYVMLSGLFINDVTAWSADKMCSINIPTDTIGLTKDGTALREISIIPVDPQPTLPADYKGLGLFYELGPSGATFKPPITISFSYKGLQLPAGTAENKISIGWIDTLGKLNILESTVDTVNKVVTAKISHFTPFGLVIPSAIITTTTTTTTTTTIITTQTATQTQKPAAFITSDLSITPIHMKPGDTATVTVILTNTGDRQGTYQVVLKVNGVAENSREVILAGGDSKSVNFTLTENQPGTYAISIDTLSASLVVQTPVTQPTTPEEKKPKATNWPVIIGGIVGGILGLFLAFLLMQYVLRPATFKISGLAVMPPVVKPGETATVVVKISNSGNKKGNYKAVLKVNNVAESSRDLTLPRGSSETVNFTVVKNNPGIYVISIDNVNGRLVVQEPRTTSSEANKIRPRTGPDFSR